MTSKYASRHNRVHFFGISTSQSGPNMCFYNFDNGVHFFDISTSKSAPTMARSAHFDFKMCFAPQRHALFRQLNVQKWSVRTCRVFTILTTACTFSTSQRPKVLQQWCLLHILISKCASGHNGVQISSLIS